MASVCFQSRSIIVALSIGFLGVSAMCSAQRGTSTAGEARSRFLANLGQIPSAKEVVVEDFINYHQHEIGAPKAGQAVGVDVRWGNESVSSNGEAILQIGLSTSLVHDKRELRPLNLTIVIDKSGSMADDNKLVRVKQALLTLVSQLRSADVLSIVAFDSDAEVVLPSQHVEDRESIRNVINSLEPGSATNLNGGLMLGYKEDLKHFQKDATNRVILLTDGVANRGETDPEKIARSSASFNDRGIDLTTIGVGLDLNRDLLQRLAKSGHGMFHFISDSQDIEKVFVKELQSQISPVATDARLEIDFGSGLKLDRAFGYDGRQSDHSVRFNLDNMNNGMTEVVLLRFKAGNEVAENSQLPVKARLTYYDIDRNKTVEVIAASTITFAEGRKRGTLEDSSVGKDYSIAVLAQAIHDMAACCESHNYRQAQTILDRGINYVTRRYPSVEDEDIKRTLTTALQFQAVLRRSYPESDTPSPREQEHDVAGSSENLIPNGDFSLGNIGFLSPELTYTDSMENCLWPSGYTIAKAFNTPLLHRLVDNQSFSAPKQPNGNEQVMFANAGGTFALPVWTSVVKCKPNTSYRLSFQCISLSHGDQYIPSFEIRVNGQRSDAQLAKYGSYVEISFNWKSLNSKMADISIVRMPMGHNGGLIGIANIEMKPARSQERLIGYG